MNDANPHLGCFGNYDRALNRCIKSGADIVLVVPDDILYCEDFQPIVEQKINDPEVGYVAIFIPKGMGDRYGFAKGWNRCNGGWGSSWGGGYVMRRDVSEKVLEHPFYQNHLKGKLRGTTNLINYEPNKRIDHCIPEVMHRMGLKQLYYAPSIVQHIGFKSTIGHVHTEAENPYMR